MLWWGGGVVEPGNQRRNGKKYRRKTSDGRAIPNGEGGLTRTDRYTKVAEEHVYEEPVGNNNALLCAGGEKEI